MIQGIQAQYGSAILRELFPHRCKSRAELAEILGLDRATITRIVQSCIERGYLTEEGEGSGGTGHEWGFLSEGEKLQGRPRIPLGIPDSLGYVVGIEIQREFVKAGALLPSGRMLIERFFPRKKDDVLLEAIKEDIDVFIHTSPLDSLPLLGIGIAVSGLVDPLQGVLFFSPTGEGGSAPLKVKEPVEQWFGVPVFVDNDAKCSCYDILTYGTGRDQRHFLYVFCEFLESPENSVVYERIGIGNALVLDGKVYYGKAFQAGEFRSAFADPQIPGQFGHAPCGYYKDIRSNSDRRHLFIEELARNIAFLANFLDLEAVYMGGGIEIFREEMTCSFAKAVADTWLYQEKLPRHIPLYIAETDAKPAVRGAAAMVYRHIFLGPLHPALPIPTGIDYLDQRRASTSLVQRGPVEI
ncbi:MAG: ROK family transcriptional regulator [Treponemataceae bacterium]|nr:ROK family transcriptional regulator [Treponemataceae bacterium]